MINIAIGFDQREAVAYHTFVQSILAKTTQPISFIPIVPSILKDFTNSHQDGSNSFTYSRFLSPWLMGFNSWVIFADSDMICREDIAKLWELRDKDKALLVVKHNYQTKSPVKYLGNKNENYPRKNWSSLILWNCSHPKNKILTPEFVSSKLGSYLHRFQWLQDDEIGSLPIEWNWLTTEYPDNYNAKLLHYTLGTPCFKDYRNSPMSDVWHEERSKMNQGLEY